MKICLIGSTRFRDEYERVNKLLALGGHIVYSVSCFTRQVDPELEDSNPPLTLSDDQKMVLDLVHLRKIQESEVVVLVGESDGKPYVGESTRRELVWCEMLEKHVVLARDIGKKYWDSITIESPLTRVNRLIAELSTDTSEEP